MPKATFNNLDDEKKTRILNAAKTVFAEKGYTGASMDAIADAANVAKGALYRYFENKQDLYFTLVDGMVDEVQLIFEHFMDERKNKNVFDIFQDMLVYIYEFQNQFSDSLNFICNLLYQENVDFKGEVLAKFGMLSTRISRSLLQRGIARGEVREDIEIDSAAFVMENVLNRFHDGVLIPYLDYGFGLYQQPKEVLDRKATSIMRGFRRALGTEISYSVK